MSRKNLSRTVIEGGRYRRNQYDRNHSHRIERATTRAWIDRARADHEEAEFTAPPSRPRVRKLFYDKLAPAMRWIDSRVGRPWNHVYAELCATFDRRTIAGAHVVDAHMLDAVARGDLSVRGGRRDFYVDAHGILRRGWMYRRSWQKVRRDILAWSRGCRAELTSSGWWWFCRVGAGPRCYDPACRSRHFTIGNGQYHATQDVADRRLTKGDLRRLARVPEDLRHLVRLVR